MTILNINKYFFVRGGAERFFFELQKLLESKGHKVIPFCMQYNRSCHPESRERGTMGSREPQNKTTFNYSQYFLSKVQTEKISFSWAGLRTVARFFWSLEARKKIKKLINKEKPELAILHNIYHQISPSILPVLKKNKILVVLIAHDYGLLSPNYNMLVRGQIYDKICGSKFLKCIPDKCVDNSFLKSLICGLETWFHHTVLNIYQKNIDYVLCPSQFMSDMFLKAGWAKEKIIHLPYFIDFNLSIHPVNRCVIPSEAMGYREPLRHPERSDGISSHKNYILFFGRLSEEKGIDTLIKAMKDLPDIKLKIVGTGPELENYRLQIADYRLQNIELLGYKSGNELNNLIANAKFILVPSIWYENYPLSILESYSFGVPALVSNLGGLPEMIPEKNKNFIFTAGHTSELKEKINFLWQNDNLLTEAGESVKNFVRENNDPEKYYQKLLKLIQK